MTLFIAGWYVGYLMAVAVFVYFERKARGEGQ